MPAALSELSESATTIPAVPIIPPTCRKNWRSPATTPTRSGSRSSAALFDDGTRCLRAPTRVPPHHCQHLRALLTRPTCASPRHAPEPATHDLQVERENNNQERRAAVTAEPGQVELDLGTVGHAGERPPTR